MGCGSSKDHTTKNIAHTNPNHPTTVPVTQPAPVPVTVNSHPNDNVDWKQIINDDNLREGSLHNINNDLWRDTKNEVAIYNAKEPTDI